MVKAFGWIIFPALLLLYCNLPKPPSKTSFYKYPGFAEDSIKAISLSIWAADQDNPQRSVDTLVPFLPWFQNLCEISGDSVICSTYGKALFEVGWANERMSKWDSAYPPLQKGYDLCIKHFGERYLLTTMFMNKLGFYYNSKGNLKKYRDFLFRSFEIRREILDSNNLFLALGYGNVAGFYDLIGDVSKAKLYKDRYNEIVRSQYNLFKSNSIESNNKLSGLNGDVIQLPNAYNRMLTSLPTRYIHTKIVDIYFAAIRKEFQLVESLFREVDSLFLVYPRDKNILKLAYFRSLAEFCLHKGDYQKALNCLDSVAIHPLAQANHETMAGILHHKSYILFHQGRVQEAIAAINSMPVNGAGDFNVNFRRLTRLAQIYFESGWYEKAIGISDTALHFFLTKAEYTELDKFNVNWSEKVPDNSRLILYFLYYKIESKIKQLEITKNKGSIETILNLFGVFNQGLVYLQEKNFGDEGKIFQETQYFPLYEKVINLAAESFSIDQEHQNFEFLLNWSDSHKSIALRNSINQKATIEQDEPQSLGFKFLEMQNTIERTRAEILKLQRENLKKDSIKFANLKSSLFEQTADLEVFQGKYQDQLARVYNPNGRMNYPMDEIVNYLKKSKSQLLDYFVGDDYLITTLLSGDSKFCYSHKLTFSEKMQLDSFTQQCGNRQPEDDLSGLSKSMYKLFIEPIRHQLTAKHLIIIPDASLYKVPFDMLEDDKGQTLIQHYAIQYEFSSRLILQKSNTDAKIAYCGFAPKYQGREDIHISDYQSRTLEQFYSESRASLGPLAFNIPEVIEGAQIMNGDSYTGEEVGKETFRERSKDARIIHLATHALTDDQNPDYSQLMFRTSKGYEPLFAYELNEYEMNTELAILSACNTGVGKYRRGDGVQSLARAFKSAGCKNILMSLWPANDASTKEIVVGFLGNIKSGMGKADALRKSKLDYLAAATPDTRLPYYWAGLVLFGDNEVMSFSKPWAGIASIMAFLFLLPLAWLVVHGKRRRIT